LFSLHHILPDSGRNFLASNKSAILVEAMEKHLKISSIITGVSFALLLISIILHNLISGLGGFEEPLFFSLFLILALVLPFALFYLSVVSIIILIKKGLGFKKK